jgi:hypothetical protein
MPGITTTLQSINASASPEVQMNENTYALAPSAFLGKDAPNTTGLVWAFLGGSFWDGSSMQARTSSTVALTGSATNFVEMSNTGSVTRNTSAFTAGQRPMYEIPTTATAVLVNSIVDHRRIAWMDSRVRFTGVTLDASNTGTVGAVTINKALGRVNITVSGTSVVVSNNFVTASSHVFAMMSTADATGRVTSVVPANGFFTLNTVAVNSQSSFDFVVVN